MNKFKTTALLLLVALTNSVAQAGEWDITGFVGIESRVFWQDARFEDQSDDLNVSAAFQPEAYWESEDSKKRFSFVGFARADSHDSQRTHVDIREANWSFEARDWDFNLGISKVFWGVTESRHLVDVINQTDLIEDIDQEDKLGQPMVNFNLQRQEDKLGQPMVNFNLQRDFGRFEFYVLPWFRERTFAGSDGRLRPPLPIDTDNPIYESDDEQSHVDFAVRYSHYFGDVDIGIYLFDGTSREPRFLIAPEGDRLLPYYEQMTQAGVELQYTHDAWLWKLEAITRNTTDDDFQAVVAGFEYSFYGIRDSSADLGILLEYMYDGRSTDAPPVSSDNDLFAGARFALNDAQDTSVLAGLAVDLDTNEFFFNVEAERRFGDSLLAELRIRAFGNAKVGDASYSVENDDYIQLRLSWYY
jgi:hypothetical protein